MRLYAIIVTNILDFTMYKLYVWCFNQTSKEEIVKGFKNAFEIEHVMTGRELCETLGISYDEIIEERKKDTKANIEYFYQQLMAIPAIKELFEDDINKVD